MDHPAPQANNSKLPVCYVCRLEVGTKFEPTLNEHVCTECLNLCITAGQRLAKAGMIFSTLEVPKQ